MEPKYQLIKIVHDGPDNLIKSYYFNTTKHISRCNIVILKKLTNFDLSHQKFPFLVLIRGAYKQIMSRNSLKMNFYIRAHECYPNNTPHLLRYAAKNKIKLCLIMYILQCDQGQKKSRPI